MKKTHEEEDREASIGGEIARLSSLGLGEHSELNKGGSGELRVALSTGDKSSNSVG